MEFLNWSSLGSCAAAATATAAITQITKELPLIRRMPTQLWSYIIAAMILMLSTLFTTGAAMDAMILSLLNAALVALSANGSFEAIRRMQAQE